MNLRSPADPAKAPLTDFDHAVARVVKAIPRGQVSSYSQVAQRAGAPGAARRVATALKRLTGVPWWRVVQAGGTLAPEVAPEQARRLRGEGVEIRGRRIVIDVPDETPADARRARAPRRRRR